MYLNVFLGVDYRSAIRFVISTKLSEEQAHLENKRLQSAGL